MTPTTRTTRFALAGADGSLAEAKAPDRPNAHTEKVNALAPRRHAFVAGVRRAAGDPRPSYSTRAEDIPRRHRVWDPDSETMQPTRFRDLD
jgi:hypothetical protein